MRRYSTTVWNTNDPAWGERLMFNTGNLGAQSLEVEVWDEAGPTPPLLDLKEHLLLDTLGGYSDTNGSG